MAESKDVLIGRLISQVGEGIANTSVARANASRAAAEAPGAMHSRYDSSKEEYQNLADSLGVRVNQKTEDANTLRSLRLPQNTFTVEEGTLVRIAEEDGSSFTDYLFLPCCGGETVQYNGGEITVVTPQSPIGQRINGKMIGDPFSLEVRGQERKYRIALVK